jgi:uncharacterized membrane protein SpoIIM required for sporulation
MNQSRFEQLYKEQWLDFAGLLDSLEKPGGKKHPDPERFSEFPMRYRRLCSHYSLARARHYSPALVDQLHHMVLRGHRQLYLRKNNFFWQGLQFIFRGFPAAVRAHAAAFWLSLLLFFGPAFIMGVTTYKDPVFIYSVMDERQVSHMESMYDPQNSNIGRGSERDGETDFAMFGYYILNNISIGFRTFAGGIVFGLGSIFFLVFNGVMIGGVAGHLSHPPFASAFWQFVAGHGAFELIAIVISGAAGLTLGRSLLFPGNFSRIDSLKSQAPESLKLVMGAAMMLVCAAFVEAFWSSSTLAGTIKYWVGGLNWVLVLLYLIFCGKKRS